MKKRIFALVAALALAVSLAGCTSNATADAEVAVKGMLDSVKAYDLVGIGTYIENEDFGSSLDESISFFLKGAFESVEYEIVSSEEADDGSVIVKTKITTIDMKPVVEDFMADFMQYALEAAFAGKEPTEEEMQAEMKKIFEASVSEPDLAKVTTEIDISVARDAENEWKVKGTEELFTAISGNVIGAMAEASQSMTLG